MKEQQDNNAEGLGITVVPPSGKGFTAEDEKEVTDLESEIKASWQKLSYNIAPKLYRLAEILHAKGRKGEGFRRYLTQIGMPKSTAYRWIAKHAKKENKTLPYPAKPTSSHTGQGAVELEKRAQKGVKAYLGFLTESEHREQAALNLIAWVKKNYILSEAVAHSYNKEEHASAA